jgi:hypothetical protein
MKLKEHVHNLVDELPDNSPLLVEVRETLRMNQAIGTALDDKNAGRDYDYDQFMEKVSQRWPRRNSA